MNIKETLKNNITLVIGLSIPVAMILFVTGSIYLPRLLSTTPPPQYNFLYTVGGDYMAKYYYTVADGHLVREETNNPANVQNGLPVKIRNSEGQLFIHDVTTNTSASITFDDAQKLQFTAGALSPDGFEVVSTQGGGGFPFSGPSNYMAKYIKKGSYSEKLNLNLGESNYWQYNFLGWVAK